MQPEVFAYRLLHAVKLGQEAARCYSVACPIGRDLALVQQLLVIPGDAVYHRLELLVVRDHASSFTSPVRQQPPPGFPPHPSANPSPALPAARPPPPAFPVS